MRDAESLAYPEKPAERDRWIVSQRPAKNSVDATLPYSFLGEEEVSSLGDMTSVATIFLTNRECPWRCLMCDLWRNTLDQIVPDGAIPSQMKYALDRLPPARWVKLYNSGSFFDPKAIPLSDYASIAKLLMAFERVIVECHPSLVGETTLQFRNLLTGQLEVAMGLETIHPLALEHLNKRMTVKQFRLAADFLRGHDVDLRVFILVQPPFVPMQEALYWAQQSIDFAFDCCATAVTVIPTRAGNGSMEELQSVGDFFPPKLAQVEAVFEYGLNAGRGRVFVDLWDIERVRACRACGTERVRRLARMNAKQVILPKKQCRVCNGEQ